MSVVPAPTQAATPPVVPGYTLQELLGRGGSGEVWRAVPRGGGAPVAVKVLLDGNPDRQAREAALLAEFDHPHLVHLHEVVHLPRRGGTPQVALVLDLLAGGSLAALLARRGRLRPGEVVTAIAPIAAALAAAHEHGVVHGDLSPGNILFTAEGRPVLTDLGMARVIGEHGDVGMTPAYVDPTVARGGAPGPASDVFGVAAAAFHALTGIPPWNAATPAETLRVAAHGELPELRELAPDAPAQLIDVISRGLAPDPHDRGSAGAFALDVRHACRPEPVRLPAAGVPDGDLGRADDGFRTELTHLRPGRRPVSEPEPALALSARPRLAGPARRLLSAVPALRIPGRVVVAAAVTALVVGAAIWVGAAVMGSRHSARAAAPVLEIGQPTDSARSAAGATVQPDPAGPDGWAAVVQSLYRRRADAFTQGSAGLLGQVYTQGSPQLQADRAALDALTSGGEVLRGFGPSPVRVTAVDTSGDRTELHLVDGWSAYEVVDRAAPDGRAVASGAARGEAPVLLVLTRTPDGWRIESIRRLT